MFLLCEKKLFPFNKKKNSLRTNYLKNRKIKCYENSPIRSPIHYFKQKVTKKLRFL